MMNIAAHSMDHAVTLIVVMQDKIAAKAAGVVMKDGQPGCCPDGEVCTGTSNDCSDPDYEPCESFDFCCPPGYTCFESGCEPPSGGPNTIVSTKATTPAKMSTKTPTKTPTTAPTTSTTALTTSPDPVITPTNNPEMLSTAPTFSSLEDTVFLSSPVTTGNATTSLPALPSASALGGGSSTSGGMRAAGVPRRAIAVIARTMSCMVIFML
ncbi:uncharacterized protein PHACADRAFT_211765 [Phanerochaete carnosa HHB-10118-sp]|uniref:Uncharacterized protein n=1 Tax=Phanerochaete carnosa (strain HHB-10118-sp) TaxID=650164 RepID=K5WQ95_PHACS|nr:uncharacterized protein PHACADRAFT_211765 [Phanerochaete carnosa HHB-10118-sp]EKM52517.1 hypothetical protein PHACADRAFT_211765 [Phanerochaete carnosa HHB-10118-sp]